MARRFKRENFLFPQDISTARPDVVARPTDPFISASEGVREQAPGRPFEPNRPSQSNRLLSLADSLGVVTQNMTTIGNKQYEDYSERATAAGAALAAEDEMRGNRQSFRQLISKTRVDSGDEAARDLMGMSPHLKRGFDQTRGRSAALGYNAALQAAYTSNPTIDEEGTKLHDVDLADPAYQVWLNDFKTAFAEENGLSSLDPTALATVLPAQKDVETRVAIAHDELRATRKLSEFENATSQFTGDILYDLNGNAEWALGNQPDALSLAANMLQNQLDEAVKLGYGGDDLQNIYAQLVENVISVAQITENPALLGILDFIEVGPESSRMLLMETAAGAKYRSAVGAASQNIGDRQFQQGQRDRQLRDQTKEDKQNEVFQNLANMARMYELTGRTDTGRAALAEVALQSEIIAAEYGFSVEWNAVKSRVMQEAVDNQGVNIIDYSAIANLESRISNREIGGEEAKSELRGLWIDGSLGNNLQAAETFTRLNQRINTDADANYAQFAGTADQAAAQFRTVVQGRLGFTEDANGQLKSVKDTLNAAGWGDDQIRLLMTMTNEELQAYIEQEQIVAVNNGRAGITEDVIRAANLIVNQRLDPFNIKPLDPGDVERQVLSFQNNLARGFENFRTEFKRDMTPQEIDDFVRRQAEAEMTGQLASLPNGNVLSSTTGPRTSFQQQQDSVMDSALSSLTSATGNPRTTEVMDEMQVITGIQHYFTTRAWHPSIVSLAAANGMTPMELLQRQAQFHGTEIDPDLMVSVGMPPPPSSSASLPNGNQSVYNRPDVSANYSPGEVTVWKGFYIDDSPPGSYDFTLLQNGRDDVNVPAPFDGVVVSVQSERDSGGYGNVMVIKDRNTGHQVRIAHADAIYFKPGDRFVKGQAIMKQGSTGNSTGPHLHVELLSSKGTRITNRNYSKPIIDRWLQEIESGYFLPKGNGGASLPGGSVGSGGGGGGLNGGYRLTKNQAQFSSVAASAARLGVDAMELAAVMDLESANGTRQKGGDGDNYHGMFQFGPSERAKYGVYIGMPVGQQMAALESFLRDRGYRPGMGIGRLYATIIGGNPSDSAYYATDSNGTSAAKKEEEFKTEGRHNRSARAFYGVD